MPPRIAHPLASAAIFPLVNTRGKPSQVLGPNSCTSLVSGLRIQLESRERQCRHTHVHVVGTHTLPH